MKSNQKRQDRHFKAAQKVETAASKGGRLNFTS
jgi:hypothetical protein